MDTHAAGITQEFAARIAATFGPDGAAWLERLPDTLNACATRWSLTLGAPFRLSYNYVAPAVRSDGSEVVLKVCPPNPEAATEVAALRLFGSATASLLEYDPGLNALLLERVVPGRPLSELAMTDDERATAVMIDVCHTLWQAPPDDHAFPTLADWARGIQRHRNRFNGGSGPLPEALFDEGVECFDWLLNTAPTAVLLHGDLHHDNILSGTRAPWLVIDPKGVVGDPGYDLGAFLYNPIPHLLAMPRPDHVLARRVDQLSEGLEMERERVRGWGLAQAILSACWSVDDGQDWQHAITCASHLAAVKV